MRTIYATVGGNQCASPTDGARDVSTATSIVYEAASSEATVTLQDAFVFDYGAGVDAVGRFQGSAKPTGLRPRFTDRFEELGIAIDPAIFHVEGAW